MSLWSRIFCTRKSYLPLTALLYLFSFTESFSQSKKVEKVNLKQLISLIDSKESPIHIVNFWATWCAPCIKELPYLQSVSDSYKQVSLTLVSLDFEENAITSKIIPLLNKKNITSRNLLMTNIDYDTWIHKVEPKWDGAIPMTLIIDNRKNAKVRRHFLVGSLTLSELQTTVSRILAKK